MLLAGLLALALSGCVSVEGTGGNMTQTPIRVEGSDTMVNVAQAWAEQYHHLHGEISVQVLGGGSGVGIASLIDGNCDLANSSRKMAANEVRDLLNKRRLEAKEKVVGLDALAVYVHRDNPLDSISLEELAEIYGEGGTLTRWSQLGLAEPPGGNDKIVFINRQNSSGTYACFREAILGKERDYKLGSIDQSGSKDVVALIANTPGAIGYSGMGYDAPGVKTLRVSKRRGQPGIAPTAKNARNGSYPITRPLQIYTAGEPAGAVRQYLDWILGPQGQAIVEQQGYVPKGD
jgi:phosphate transport system substrate-binding protein